MTGMASPELAVGVMPFVFGNAHIGFGLRFRATYDQWSTTGSVSNTTTSCTPPNDFSAVEILAMPTVFGSGSLAPDFYAAADVSVSLSDQVRVVLYPLTFDVHPAYVGARSDGSIDASGPWWRLGAGVSLAVDL